MEQWCGSISLFGGLEPRRTDGSSDSFTGFIATAEASFAHSKRFAHHDITVQVGASMFEGATEPRGSVWSARSLLPLWRVGRQLALGGLRSGHSKSEML